ncbi:helix-turn-helix domain-containing protein [Paenibacillus thalictri]|uniref:helix-turn-helix domain-containing protein n=1 Tax=Paenibacillus thalictri TaxID=2527873 RepID=UPI0013EF2CE0|nr:helix-turn-helix domain-containing protein [Paenibacillus thalictri]
MTGWYTKLMTLLFGGYPFKRGRYFYRLIWLGCISACVPVMLAGIVYYHFSLTNLSNQMMSENASSLIIIENRVERVIQGIERDALQLADEPLIKESLSMENFGAARLYHSQLLDYLIRQKNSRDFVESIYYYNNSANILLTTELGYVLPSELKIKSDLDSILKIKRSQWVFLPEAEKKGLVSFVRLIPSTANQTPAGVLVFQIKINMIREYLTEYSMLLEKSVYVLDQQNRLLFAGGNGEMEEGGERLVRDIQALGPGNGTVTDAEGSNFLYSYVKSDLGRSFISVIPESSLAARIWWIRWVSICTLLLLLGLGLLLSLIISRRAYNPLQNLMKYGSAVSQTGTNGHDQNEFVFIMDCFNQLRSQTQSLSVLVKNLEPTSRERFLQKLLTRDYMNEKTLREECETFKIPVYGDYWAVVIDIDHYYKNTRYIPEDRPILSFAVSNILEELMKSFPKLKGFGVNDAHGRKVVLVQAETIEELLLYAQSVHESVGQYLSLQATVGIGRMYHHIGDISVAYKEALLALQYRMFDEQPILYIDRLETADKRERFVYPAEIESAILQALKEGDEASSGQNMEQFTKHIKSFQSYPLTFQAYSMLLSSILHRLETFGELPLEVLEGNSFEKLKEFRTVEEINEWFVIAWFPLYLKASSQYHGAYNQSYIQQICRFVEENIYTDISLVICAEQVNMNPSYVSRVFKKEKGVSFVEYVMEIKLNEACRLLLETDKSIGEIAGLLGYSERNLNRLFQKFMQMPPGQYRSQQR